MEVSTHLFHDAMNDLHPSPAAVVDFGITTQEHLDAMYLAIRKGASQEELRECMGNGKKITAVVRKYVPNAPEFKTYLEAQEVIV